MNMIIMTQLFAAFIAIMGAIADIPSNFIAANILLGLSFIAQHFDDRFKKLANKEEENDRPKICTCRR